MQKVLKISNKGKICGRGREKKESKSQEIGKII
jgi:hypothetical protein